MVYILLFITLIAISIISSILISRNENKKDRKLLENKIRKDFIELYGKNLKANGKRKEEYKDYLKSDHWQEIRLKALDRAGYRCQLCSKRECLNVHHNTYDRKGKEDLRDLVVLCRECHKKFHNIVS